VANYGQPARYVTVLPPSNPIADAFIGQMRSFGIDTSYIKRQAGRFGIYFVEPGANQRPSKVVYDRKYSAIAMAQAGDFNWAEVFQDASWFHFTGITPALGDNVAAITLEACQAAKKAGLRISCDLNYRKNLWSTEKAGKTMAQLMEYVDICIANEEDAEKVFGIKAPDTDITGGKLNHDGYKAVARELAARFKFEKVAITLRGSISASDNNWAAMLFDGQQDYFSKNYPIHIVDRVGGGDSFGAGLIYSLLKGLSPQETIEFAVAASCLKHTIYGDFNQVSVAEVTALMKGDASGRVQR
jgi:2-dehydro-3-deoxygluconokinase